MTTDREWVLLNPGPANTTPTVRRTYAFRVSNMGTLAPRDMEKVVAAFAACLEELGITAVSRR